MGKQLPQWEPVVMRTDEFALKLTNPSSVDAGQLRHLLDKVVKGRGVVKNFHKQAKKDWETWLNGKMTGTLPSRAYARLSNWFLTDKEDRKTVTFHASAMNKSSC